MWRRNWLSHFAKHLQMERECLLHQLTGFLDGVGGGHASGDVGGKGGEV
jgi:hypothetical protein